MPSDLDGIRARDAATELMGEPLNPPEGVVFTDSCVMRAYDRRALLAALDALTAEYDEDRMAYLIRFANSRYDAARALADELAEALKRMVAHDDEQRDACGDWGTDSCPHNDAARAALAKWEAGKPTLQEVSIVHTDAGPGEMDEHGAWGFKKAVAYTNVTDDDWVMAEEER